jgi:hypothetical protein
MGLALDLLTTEKVSEDKYLCLIGKLAFCFQFRRQMLSILADSFLALRHFPHNEPLGPWCNEELLLCLMCLPAA